MKLTRHARIKDIIAHEIIETQEDLADALKKRNIAVTQATVSRDIKELMLIKVPIGDGRYRYAAPMENSIMFTKNRMTRLFQDSVTSIDFSENIVVIKTLPGTANAVAAAIDHANWNEVIGTVAGDDNIIVVVKPKDAVAIVIERLNQLTAQDGRV